MLKINVMQVDNIGIDFSGQATPEMLHLDIIDAGHHDIDFEQLIVYNLHVSLVSNGMLLAGTLSTAAKCICGRCLQQFDFEFNRIEVCHFYEDFNENELDVAPKLREELLISLPMKYICKEDCPGVEYDVTSKTLHKKVEAELDAENNIWKDLEGLDL